MYHAIKDLGGDHEPYATDGFATLQELDADMISLDKAGIDERTVIVQVHMDGTITVGTIKNTFEQDWRGVRRAEPQEFPEPVHNPWRVPFLTEQRNA